MKKVFIFILILAVYVIAQQSAPTGNFKVKVDNFTGGVNLSGDSTDLGSDEMLSCQNFTLTANSLESRRGISTWNANAIETSGVAVKINNIFIYEPFPDTFRLCIVAAGFVYIIPTLDSPRWDTTSFPGDVDSAWGQYRLGFSGDSITAVHNEDEMHSLKRPTWWYGNVNSIGSAGGDIIIIDEDSSGSEYDIQYIQAGTDSILEITTYPHADSGYRGKTDSVASFTIYKRFLDTSLRPIQFKQIGGDLYISNGADFTIVYDDANYNFLSVIDTGTVTSTVALLDSIVSYNEGTVKVTRNSNVIRAWRDADFGATTNNVTVGMIFVLIWDIGFFQSGGNQEWIRFNGRFASEIITIDSTANTLELADNITLVTPQGQVITPWTSLIDQPYEIVNNLRPCNFDANMEVRDANKNWFDDQYGDQYLLGFYNVDSESGENFATLIYCNSDSGFSIDSLFVNPVTGNNYYIFSDMPRHGILTDSDADIAPFFEQVMLSNGQLFGFGDQTRASLWRSGGVNEYRIWFSEVNIPRLRKAGYSFDIDKTENITTMFELINGNYIATTNSIWRFSGIGPTDVQSGNLNVRKIVSNVGIPDIDNWAQATLEYIYFADETGLYVFNGIRPKKISHRVDPLFGRYSQSDLVMGYFPLENQLFISWPDSGVTWIYDENYDAFVGPFDFGMTCMNQQSAELDTTIFFFGHSDTLGYVFFYPNSVYSDSMPGASVNIGYEYLSGHQSYGDYSYPKKPLEIAVSTQSPGVMEIAFYMGFSTSKADSFITDSTGNFVHVPSFDRGLAFGEYVQTGITASAGEKVILRGYTTELQWLRREEK